MRSGSFLLVAALASLAALAVTGCESYMHPDSSRAGALTATRPAAPDAAVALGVDARRGLGFVPLALGDRWRYQYRFSGVLVGDPAGLPLYDESGEFVDDIACEQDVAGLHYAVSRRLYNGDVNTPGWTRYRQDRDGLYVLDFADNSPPPCDAGPTPRPETSAVPVARMPALETFAFRLPRGAAAAAAWQRAYVSLEARHALLLHLARELGSRRIAPGEIQQLAYPLLPGRHWIIRDDPRFEARVERAVQLRIGRPRLNGWSIRIRSEWFGPEDVVHVFWGRAGYLGLEADFVADATDDSGNLIGKIRTHETQSLIEVHLASSGLAVSAATPERSDR